MALTASNDQKSPSNDAFEAAMLAHQVGLCVIPPKQDGSKAPLVSWKPYQECRPTVDQINSWYKNYRLTGIGLVTGKISNNLEVFDFDDPQAYGEFKQRAEDLGHGPLVKKIEKGYLERTPKGVHLPFYCGEISGSQKLAQRLKRPEEMKHENDRVQVKIETRGEGGFIIVAPSSGPVNPAGSYELIHGSFDTIVTISPEEREALLKVARSLDEMPRQQYKESRESAEGGRPGDDFSKRASWEQILEPKGFTKVYEKDGVDHWRRPGKEDGVSATTNYADSDLFYPFSTSTVFEAERGYSKFSVYAKLYHDDDFRAAARALRQQGYGADTSSSIIEDLNELFAWVDKTKQIFRFEYRDHISVADFKNALANKSVVVTDANGNTKRFTAAEAWLKSKERRQHKAVVYEPGKPLIVNNCINLWRGWGCEPREGNIQPFLDLLNYIFSGNQEMICWLTRWLAYPIQSPGQKLNTAVTLWSRKQGVGKTLLAETIGSIYGANFTTISAAELHGSFNGWANAMQFILGEENASTNHRADANKLKHLITGQTIQINEKFQPTYELRNTINFLFTSNHPDAFHLDINDRRFFIWEITGERMPDKFYADFVDWRDKQGGLQALMYYLQHVDLSDFNPKAAAPYTQAKEEMIDMSMTDLERWLYDLMENGIAAKPFKTEVVTAESLVNEYLAETHRMTTTTAVGKALKRLGGFPCRRVMASDGRHRLYAVTRPEHWSKQENAAWAAEYEKSTQKALKIVNG